MGTRKVKILWIDEETPESLLLRGQLEDVLLVPYTLTVVSFSRVHVGQVAGAAMILAQVARLNGTALERFLLRTSKRVPVVVICPQPPAQVTGAVNYHRLEDPRVALRVVRAICHTMAGPTTVSPNDSVLHRRFREVSVLHAVAVAGTEATGVGHLVNHALQSVGRSLFPRMKVAVGLLDESGDRLEIQVYSQERHSAYRLPAHQGLVSRVMSTGQSVKLPDIERPPPFCDLDPAARAVLYMPLGTRDGILGVIFLESPEPAVFQDEDERVLATIALQLASAIEKRRLFEEIQQMAITDPLTGLFNRRHFFELAQREFSRARRYSRPLTVLMMDIDHFKLVNDRYGHPAGDEALRTFADRLRGSIRTSDIIGRYGGEEFTVILTETPFTAARVVAERIRRSMADNPIATRSGTLTLTVSIGLSSHLPGTPDLDSLINEADQALLAAKRGGRNRVVLHPRLARLALVRVADTASVAESTAPALREA